MRGTILISTILLAGCLGGASPDEPDALAQTPSREAVAFDHAIEDCIQVENPLPGDADELASFVPAGFTVAADPLVIMGAMVCDNEIARGFWAIQVEPTDEALRSDRAVNHFWLPDHFVTPTGPWGDALDGVHAVAREGNVSLSYSLTELSYTLRGPNATYTWTASGTNVPAGWPVVATALSQNGAFREYFPAEGGYAYIDANFGYDMAPASEAGGYVGTLETSGEGAAATYYGPSATLPGLYGSGLAYAGAEMGYVPYP